MLLPGFKRRRHALPTILLAKLQSTQAPLALFPVPDIDQQTAVLSEQKIMQFLVFNCEFGDQSDQFFVGQVIPGIVLAPGI